MKAADTYCKQKGYRGFVADQSLLNLGMKFMNPLPDDTLRYTKGEAFEYHVNTPTNLEMPYMGNCSGFFHIYAAQGEAGVKNNPYFTPGQPEGRPESRRASEEVWLLHHPGRSRLLLSSTVHLCAALWPGLPGAYYRCMRNA